MPQIGLSDMIYDTARHGSGTAHVLRGSMKMRSSHGPTFTSFFFSGNFECRLRGLVAKPKAVSEKGRRWRPQETPAAGPTVCHCCEAENCTVHLSGKTAVAEPRVSSDPSCESKNKTRPTTATTRRFLQHPVSSLRAPMTPRYPRDLACYMAGGCVLLWLLCSNKLSRDSDRRTRRRSAAQRFFPACPKSGGKF